ncbi:MAG: FimV/HubP family polar landmark protein, partial [Spongiibacter sp.]
GEGARADDAIGGTGAETEQVPAADVADGLAELSLDIDEDIAELSDAGDLEDLSDLDSALAELDAEVGDFDFSEPVEPVEPAAEQPTSAEEKADQELDSLIDAADRDADSETNTDTITDDSTAPTTSDVAAIDLDDLVFDEFDASADDDDIGMLSDGDDVATKLDLARAYVELGDNDGAREMLEEVMQEGSEQQRDDARALLEQLA